MTQDEYAEYLRRVRREAEEREAKADAGRRAKADDQKLRELVGHANGLIETLRRFENEDSDEGADGLAAQCISQSLDALSSLVEQPFLTDPLRVADALKRTGYNVADGQTFEQLIQQMRYDPAVFETFLTFETQLLVDAGATPATLAWARTVLIARVNDFTPDKLMDGPQVAAAAEQAKRDVASEKPSPKTWKRIKRRVIAAVEIVLGGAVMAADIPLTVPSAGFASVSVAIGSVAVGHGLGAITEGGRTATA